MAVIYALLFLIAGWGFGLRLIELLDPLKKLSKLERFLGEALTGFLILNFTVLVFALLGKSLSLAILLGTIVGLFLGYGPIKKIWSAFKFIRPKSWFSWQAVILTALLVVFLGVVFQVLLTDSQGFPQATLIGWGDVAYHLDMIGHLANSQPFTVDQPVANGFALTYPFFINFFSAVLVKMGLGLMLAWYMPTLIFSLTLFFGLYVLGKRLFSSKAWAIAMVTLVLFGGGLGFFVFFKDIHLAFTQSGSSGIIQTIKVPPHQYTHLDSRTGGKPQIQDSPLNIVWITPAISFFSHQRSFATGASLLIFLLLGWVVYDRSEAENGSYYYARWLPLLGLLPLLHTHTVIAAGIIFFAFFLYKLFKRENVKWWLLGALAALFIAIPQLMLFFQSKFIGAETGNSLFKLWWGWMTCTHQGSWSVCDPNTKGADMSAIWFWTKNFGVILWAWVIGIIILIRSKTPSLVKILIPASILLFLIPNLILFQPWEFDNNKLLFYWWLFAVIIGLCAIKQINQRWLQTTLLVAILIFGSLAGFVDASTRVHQIVNAMFSRPILDHAGYYAQTETDAAAWIQANTKPNDAFLASDGAGNFVPMLTGRPLFLGYTGWLWTQGHAQLIDQRKNIAKSFFLTNNPTTLCAMGVRWLMWEPAFLSTYPEAGSFNPSLAGISRFTQNTPYGQRQIFKLSCAGN